MRKIKIVKDKGMSFTDSKIEGFMEREVSGSSTGAVVYVPKEYIGKRVYVVICK